MSETHRARQVRKALRASAGPKDLAKIDPRSTPGLDGRPDDPKAWSREQVAELGVSLAAQQEQLYAAAEAGAGRRRVLLILQAMDCGGKDGTVEAVVGTMNPLGLRIMGFGPRVRRSAAHDFLWRIQPGPAAGRVRRRVQPVAVRGRADRTGTQAGPA